MTRLAIVADIHHGAPSHTKRGDAALDLLADFARFAADAKADAAIDLGDRISDIDRATDLRLAAEVAEAFRAVSAPRHHVDGNHDLAFLEPEDNAAALGRNAGHQTLDLDGWRIALWRADARIRREPGAAGFRLSEPDLLWLSRTVQAADRPLLIVSHVPLSGHAQTGNYYFEENPEVSAYPETPRIRAALAQARVPVVCLAGHVHWNTVTTVDGVTHLTQQSLTESFTTEGEPAAAMGLIELGETLRWRVEGRDPIAVEITPRAARWTPRLGRFAGLPPRGAAA